MHSNGSATIRGRKEEARTIGANYNASEDPTSCHLEKKADDILNKKRKPNKSLSSQCNFSSQHKLTLQEAEKVFLHMVGETEISSQKQIGDDGERRS